MNILTSWLREWACPNASDEKLVQKLTMAGLEVDGINPVAPYFEKVVVGKVIKCEKHPNADKLNLCQVDVGADKKLQIICGAENVRVNLNVVVATIGAKLPNGLKIKKAKLRDVESFGMICSESELGLADKSDGIIELENDAPIGESIRKYLNLDDNIIELDITPNRGDCFCILGVAREVVANYNLQLKLPKYEVKAAINDKVNANIIATKDCPKYLTRVVKNIDNSVKTPKWMAQKLIRCGQQLHSPVVDITNFVLLELGQPMHAFALDKINGDINVRRAKNGEKIELLNEQTVKLKDNTLIIADSKKPLAIAGIMGGMASSTQDDSTNILLESAFFSPASIAGRAREYTLHTESSLRFERGVDFNITRMAIERATELIIDICGGLAGEVSESVSVKDLPKLEPVTITKDKIKKILGFKLEANWITDKFKSLDFEITNQDENSWTIEPPSFRFDIRTPADLIEELARLYGYDKLPVQKLSLNADINIKSRGIIDKSDISKSLINRGYQEVITYSFISNKYQDLITPEKDKIKLINPISTDMEIMRPSLWAGLLQTVKSNQKRGVTNAKFFEIGLCFDGIKANEQIQKIAGVITGNRFEPQWAEENKELDFFDIKADVESILALSAKNYTFIAADNSALQKGQSANILKNNKKIGCIGALSPSVQNELSLPKCYLFELDLSSVQITSVIKYEAFSAYQKSTRDIALVVDENIPVADIIKSIKDIKQKDLIDVSLFDIYTGENIEKGKKSIALNLSYQSNEYTLNDEKINAKIDEILKFTKTKYSAIQR